MSSHQPQDAIIATRDALLNALGDQLQAVYLYGSLAQSHYIPTHSDINLLAVVDDSADIFPLRKIFQPVWWRYRQQLKTAPLIAKRTAFERHLYLYPAFAHHLDKQGKQIFGSHIQPRPPVRDAADTMANLLIEVLQASQALTPSLLTVTEATEINEKLFSIARRLGLQVQSDFPPFEVFAQIQQRLRPALKNLPDTWDIQHFPDAPPVVPDLQAIYEKSDKLIFVMPALSPDRIRRINWAEMGNLLADQCTGLQLATPQQLRMVVEYETPLDHLLFSYNLDWGADVLDIVPKSRRLIMRDAGRLPSNIELAELPHIYLTAGDGEMPMVIHDFQNKLLNVQLRHELLVRTNQAIAALPPHALPGRDVSHENRIRAIFEHLHWWANYYTNSMLNYDR